MSVCSLIQMRVDGSVWEFVPVRVCTCVCRSTWASRRVSEYRGEGVSHGCLCSLQHESHRWGRHPGSWRSNETDWLRLNRLHILLRLSRITSGKTLRPPRGWGLIFRISSDKLCRYTFLVTYCSFAHLNWSSPIPMHWFTFYILGLHHRLLNDFLRLVKKKYLYDTPRYPKHRKSQFPWWDILQILRFVELGIPVEYPTRRKIDIVDQYLDIQLWDLIRF